MNLARKNARVQQNWTSWLVKLTHTLLYISLKLRENGLRKVYYLNFKVDKLLFFINKACGICY
jgi:hypothetical protein